MLASIAAMVFYCPKCASPTRFHEWKNRSAWTGEGKDKIPQLRVICRNPACKATHVIIPDFIQPFKRYIGKEIEAVIADAEGEPVALGSETVAEESTKYRWIRQFNQRYWGIVQKLEYMLLKDHEKLLSLVSPGTRLKRLRQLLRLFPEHNQSTTLGGSNLLLNRNGETLFF